MWRWVGAVALQSRAAAEFCIAWEFSAVVIGHSDIAGRRFGDWRFTGLVLWPATWLCRAIYTRTHTHTDLPLGVRASLRKETFFAMEIKGRAVRFAL